MSIRKATFIHKRFGCKAVLFFAYALSAYKRTRKMLSKTFSIVNANLSGNMKKQQLTRCVNVKTGQNVIVEGAWIR